MKHVRFVVLLSLALAILAFGAVPLLAATRGPTPESPNPCYSEAPDAAAPEQPVTPEKATAEALNLCHSELPDAADQQEYLNRV